MMADHCTCRYGRDHDGSEFGPCEYCERVADEERLATTPKCKPGECCASEVIHGNVFTIYRCKFCGDEEWL